MTGAMIVALPPLIHLILDIAGGVGLVYAVLMLIVAWRVLLRWHIERR